VHAWVSSWGWLTSSLFSPGRSEYDSGDTTRAKKQAIKAIGRREKTRDERWEMGGRARQLSCVSAYLLQWWRRSKKPNSRRHPGQVQTWVLLSGYVRAYMSGGTANRNRTGVEAKIIGSVSVLHQRQTVFIVLCGVKETFRRPGEGNPPVVAV